MIPSSKNVHLRISLTRHPQPCCNFESGSLVDLTDAALYIYAKHYYLRIVKMAMAERRTADETAERRLPYKKRNAKTKATPKSSIANAQPRGKTFIIHYSLTASRLHDARCSTN